MREHQIMSSVWILFLIHGNDNGRGNRVAGVFESKAIAEREAKSIMPLRSPDGEYKVDLRRDVVDEKSWFILSRTNDNTHWADTGEYRYIHKWEIIPDVLKNIKPAKRT